MAFNIPLSSHNNSNRTTISGKNGNLFSQINSKIKSENKALSDVSGFLLSIKLKNM